MEITAWFDIIVIALTLILGVKGILNGLIKEMFGLIGLIGGLVLASRFSQAAEKFISDNIYKFENASMLQFVGFIALWIVFWLVCLMVGKFLSRLIAVSGLSFLDRFGGFIAGSGKIFLTFAAVLAVASGTHLNDMIAPYFKDSKVYPVLLNTGKWIINLDVKNIKDEIGDMLAKEREEESAKPLITIETNEDNSTIQTNLTDIIETNTTKGDVK